MKCKWLAMVAALTLSVGVATAKDARTLGEATYNAETKVLTVSFSDGKTYEYADVPAETYEALQSAESRGEYFNKNIRGKYKASKVSK